MRRLTYEQVKIKVEEQGYFLLSETYKHSSLKLDIQCSEGHRYKARFDSFQQGQRCPVCAYTKRSKALALPHEVVRRYIEQEGYALLSKEYKNSDTKLDIQCDKGHAYQASYSCFKRGHRCPYCAGQVVTYEQVKRAIERQGYHLLSRYYKNAQTKLCIQCNKGHQYEARWNDFKTGYRCPQCRESKGERIVSKILLRLNVPFIRDYRLTEGKSLELDFYISLLNLGIEYDGEQHFRPVQFRGISLKKAEELFRKTQERDRRKETLCQEKGICLFRIKYTENIRNIRKMLNDIVEGR